MNCTTGFFKHFYGIKSRFRKQLINKTGNKQFNIHRRELYAANLRKMFEVMAMIMSESEFSGFKDAEIQILQSLNPENLRSDKFFILQAYQIF